MPPKTNAKYVEACALRKSLINKLQETLEVAKLAQNQPSLITLFKKRYEHVDDTYSKVEASHEHVISLLSSQEDPDFEAEDMVRREVDTIYFEIATIFEQLIPPAPLANVSKSQSSNFHSNVRLPKINLRNFDGSLEQWPPFIQLFNTVIHNVTSLTNIEKYQYLVSCLSGEPLNLIKSLELSDDNYPIAYQTLIDRYDDKRRLATHYWHKLYSLPQLKEESLKGLRNLFDNFRESLAALRALKIDNSLEDFILVNLLLDKLDSNTRRLFESEIRELKQGVPAFKNLETFIESQCRVLDTVANATLKPAQFTVNRFRPSKESKYALHATSNDVANDKCFICHKSHLTYLCNELLGKSPQQRFELIKVKRLCVNCLSAFHNVRTCKSNSRCRKCDKSHHTLLHFETPATPNIFVTPVQSEPSTSTNTPTSAVTALVSSTANKIVLLSTALVDIRDVFGQPHTIRAILDSGSEGSFITSTLSNRLGLRIKNSHKIQVQGIGSSSAFASSGTVSCCIYPHDEVQPCHIIDAHVIPCISRSIPATEIDASPWFHIKGLRLADPQFNIPSKVDLLLGADIFAQLLRPGLVTGPDNTPAAMNTVFGWILSGQANATSQIKVNSFFSSLSEQHLDSTLKRFWELEEISCQIPPSQEDVACEGHYSSHVKRDSDGRYSVALPFKTPNPQFLRSRAVALRRLHLLEGRLSRNEPLRKTYVEFMKDYLDSGHMSLAPPSGSAESFYIPHHCVIKPDSSTTKLRVVFDASARDFNAQSLNDCLYSGPKLLPNIVDVLLKFRSHAIVLIADIKQMYRQIMVSPTCRDYQRILWRFSLDDPVQEYVLNTVTYGVSAAPFLAIRTLHQLAQDEQQNFPKASEVLKQDVYVDDVVSGCNSLSEAQDLQIQLINLLNRGGFLLRKWASNKPELLSGLDTGLCQDGLSFDIDSNSTIKILGLQWFHSQDAFSFKVDSIRQACTKRQILSEIARVFDPLGFLAPLTFLCKRLIQHLWCLGLDWDATPPEDIIDRWNRYREQLSCISNIHIDRYLLSQNYSRIELHGFCDSSEAGYAAVIYFRVIANSEISIKLVTAKTKVAPLKKRSLPQLELCGAHLLSNLISSVTAIYVDQISQIFAWTDSTIVLAWLRASPHRWKTFVSNRVSHIQERVSPSCWRHVRSEDNPADCASRGLLPQDLIQHPLWWAGPLWLKSSSELWPMEQISFSHCQDDIAIEERNINVFVAQPLLEIWDNLLERHSSLDKILRVITYCRRFVRNLRNPRDRIFGAFTATDLQGALSTLVRCVQEKAFHSDITKLKQNKCVSKPLRKLNPFLDNQEVLRVGGRLCNSQLSFEEKHPALLPQSHRLTVLIIEHTHQKYLHPGCKTLQYLLQQNFWILSAHRAIRRCLSNCYKCFRSNPQPLQPPMGDLPAVRVQQVRAFTSVGVDFGGPYTITTRRARGAKTYKAWICLFVCLSTKALHLELVSELSTNAFLAGLRRFIARRGRCSVIMSDCGTNFVGAARILTEYFRNAADQENIAWKFNPPSAPHFGGIWEAGIKSVKTHLNRVVGGQLLTYEEFLTVLIQIEAVLNSRPLCPLSSDPNDLEVLTPGHYLTLAPLTCIPDPDYTQTPLNRLSRWQLLQQMHQHFWQRWQHEYLHTLQQRAKWTSTSSPLNEGVMVLIRDELSPPMRWRLGRVMQLHPDGKGIARVATIKTCQGVIKRPFVKLCPLPNQ